MNHPYRQINTAAFELIVYLGENCGPSELLRPALGQIGNEYKHLLRVEPVDISQAHDRVPDPGVKVTSTPTLCLYGGGQLLAVHDGTMLPSQLRNWIRQVLLDKT